MSHFKELKELKGHLGSDWFPKITTLIQYVLPKTDEQTFGLPNQPWFKRLAWIAPFIAIGIVGWIFFWPILWVIKYDFDGLLFEYFVVFFHWLSALIGFISVLILLGFAAFLKFKKRNPRLLLAITPLVPFRMLLFIFVMHFMYWGIGLHNPKNVGDKGKIYLMEKAYKKAPIKDDLFNGNKFFGMRLGEETFDKVKEILDTQKADYEVAYYDKENKRYPIITVYSFEPFNNLFNGPKWFQRATIEFNREEKLYQICIKRKEGFEYFKDIPDGHYNYMVNQVKQKGITAFRQYLEEIYKPIMFNAGFRGLDRSSYFYTGSGALIDFHGDLSIFITYIPFRHSMEKICDHLRLNTDYFNTRKEAAKMVEANSSEKQT